MGGKFKFQVQDSDLEYLFWQCKKYIALSEKKPPLEQLITTILQYPHRIFLNQP
jgi:hypothetical protein